LFDSHWGWVYLIIFKFCHYNNFLICYQPLFLKLIGENIMTKYDFIKISECIEYKDQSDRYRDIYIRKDSIQGYKKKFEGMGEVLITTNGNIKICSNSFDFMQDLLEKNRIDFTKFEDK
jgi:hypothetical protein